MKIKKLTSKITVAVIIVALLGCIICFASTDSYVLHALPIKEQLDLLGGGGGPSYTDCVYTTQNCIITCETHLPCAEMAGEIACFDFSFNQGCGNGSSPNCYSTGSRTCSPKKQVYGECVLLTGFCKSIGISQGNCTELQNKCTN